MESKIYLNDLLNIDLETEDYKKGRMTFSTHLLDSWITRREEETEIGPDFSFWAMSSQGKRHYLRGGELVISLVQMEKNDTWLLASICRVKKINLDGPCEREPIQEYRKFFGRVIVKLHKLGQGYNFLLSTYLKKCEVLKILEKEYGGKQFPGFENICENMRMLMTYLNEGHLGETWKLKLGSVKGIYCLSNHDEGKVYIGSAYNKTFGMMKRWEDYFKSFHGQNVELEKLFKRHENDENYFLDNFYFSVLEVFPENIEQDYVIKREHHWMDVFNSRNSKSGYNRN